MADDDITVRLRVRDSRRFASDIDTAGRSVRRVGDEADRAERKQSALAKAGRGTSRAFGVLGTAAAGAAGVIGKQSVTAAVDLGEQINKTRVVFRGSDRDILRWSKTTSTGLGISRRQALEATGVFGNMLVPMGLARKRAGDMSQRMVALAADMASFNNASPEDTLDALRAGLAGETEPLRRYGVFLNEARIKQEAQRLGLVKGTKDSDAIRVANLRATVAQRRYNEAVHEHGSKSREALSARASLITAENSASKAAKGSTKDLSAAAKAQATYSLFLKDTKDAQGDFARTSDSLANRQRILSAQWENITAKIGVALLPVLEKAAGALSRFFAGIERGRGPGAELSQWLTRAWNAAQKWATGGGPARVWEDMKRAAKPLGPVLRLIMRALENPAVQKAVVSVAALGLSFKLLNKASGGAVGGMARFSISGVQLTTAIVGLIANITAYRTATIASAAADNVGAAARTRATVATVATGVATGVASAATTVWAGAQWLLNAALTANPIGLVIAALVAIGVAIVIAYRKSERFRSVVHWLWGALKDVFGWAKKHWPLLAGIVAGPIGVAVGLVVKHWDVIKSSATAVWHWVARTFTHIVTTVKSLPGRIGSAATGMWDGIKNAFRDAINWILSKWNELHFSIGGTHIPGIGHAPKFTISTPDIPLLASGGIVHQAGSVIVGDAGTPELLSLPRGARVDPLPPRALPAIPALMAPTGGGGGSPSVAELYVDGRKMAEAVFRHAADAKARR